MSLRQGFLVLGHDAKLPCFDSRLRGPIYYYNTKHCRNHRRSRAKTSITSSNYMTVAVIIQLGNDVSLSFGSNAGGPSLVDEMVPLSRWQLEVVIRRT